MSESSKELVRQLVVKLKAADANDSRQALDQLVAFGDEAVALLLEVIRAEENSPSSRAIEAFSRIGSPAAVQALCECLQLEDESVSVEVIDALGRFGSRAHPAVEGLRKIIQGCHCCIGDLEITAAVQALGSIGPPAAPAVSDLHALLQRTYEHAHELRLSLNLALWKITGDATCIDPLIDALANESAAMRMTAANVLAEVGPAAVAAVPALQNLVHDDNRLVRQEALRTLALLGAPSEGPRPAAQEGAGATADLPARGRP